ncbi:MAG: hypothetical protein OXI53_09735 [Nitrospira sp.]|nr:hypothetical protein [Nitrospira sp.]MDE0487292.1 hypothetical protein [Nitrospira sp.]
MHRTKLIAFVVTIMTAVGSSAFADGVSPWLPAPGAGFINLSYVSQNANQFYVQDNLRGTPPQNAVPDGKGPNLGQHTVWLNGMYGLSDEIAIDFRVGAARSYASAGPTGGRDKYGGVTDSNIGVTWRIVDELVKPSLPSLALRGGVIIEGSYTPGYINSIGDGASGLEMSALAGKYLADWLAISGEVGYRVRDEDVPSDLFVNVSGGVLFDNIGLSVNYKLVDAQSGLQIGVPPFTPGGRVFPRLEEDVQFLSGTVSLNVTEQTNVALSYGEVIDGRNTSKSKVFSVTMSYLFDTTL